MGSAPFASAQLGSHKILKLLIVHDIAGSRPGRGNTLGSLVNGALLSIRRSNLSTGPTDRVARSSVVLASVYCLCNLTFIRNAFHFPSSKDDVQLLNPRAVGQLQRQPPKGLILEALSKPNVDLPLGRRASPSLRRNREKRWGESESDVTAVDRSAQLRDNRHNRIASGIVRFGRNHVSTSNDGDGIDQIRKQSWHSVIG